MNNLGGFFDRPKKEAVLGKIEAQISEPDFWGDSEKAQKIMGQRSRIENALQQQDIFETGFSDAEVLFELAEADADSAALEQSLTRLLSADAYRATLSE